MSRLRILILGLFIVASITFNALIGLAVFKVSIFDQFNVAPLFFQDSADSTQYFQPQTLSVREMTDHQRTLLTAQLIEEYIVARYTVIADKDEMARRNGVWLEEFDHLGPSDAGLHQHRVAQSPKLWEHFTTIDLKTIQLLIKNNTSRTVEILRTPVEDNGFWIVRFKIHDYSLDGTLTTSIKKARLRVKLYDDVRNWGLRMDNPSLYFNMQVLDFTEMHDLSR